MKKVYYIIWIIVVLFAGYKVLTMESIDTQTQKLAHSLSVLSGEINTIRTKADEARAKQYALASEKEKKYNDILSQLTNYQPHDKNIEIWESDNGTKPLSRYKCLDENNSIVEKEYNDSELEFYDSCKAFEGYNGCYIHSNGYNCFKE